MNKISYCEVQINEKYFLDIRYLKTEWIYEYKLELQFSNLSLLFNFAASNECIQFLVILLAEIDK